MVFRAPLAVGAAGTVVAGSLASCGVDSVPDVSPATSACTAYAPPSTFDAAAPAVSFSQQVIPLITRSCGYPSCHGDPSAPAAGMYLGSDTSQTWLDLVGVPSNALPTMPRVKAGDPEGSLLQRKIDGDACTLSGCSTICAQSMPEGQDLMAVTDRLTFRAWIAQGALADFPLLGPDGGLLDAGGP